MQRTALVVAGLIYRIDDDVLAPKENKPIITKDIIARIHTKNGDRVAAAVHLPRNWCDVVYVVEMTDKENIHDRVMLCDWYHTLRNKSDPLTVFAFYFEISQIVLNCQTIAHAHRKVKTTDRNADVKIKSMFCFQPKMFQSSAC